MFASKIKLIWEVFLWSKDSTSSCPHALYSTLLEYKEEERESPKGLLMVFHFRNKKKIRDENYANTSELIGFNGHRHHPSSTSSEIPLSSDALPPAGKVAK